MTRQRASKTHTAKNGDPNEYAQRQIAETLRLIRDGKLTVVAEDQEEGEE